MQGRCRQEPCGLSARPARRLLCAATIDGLAVCPTTMSRDCWRRRAALSRRRASSSAVGSACARSAPCPVERVHVLVKRLARYRHEPGCDLSVHLAALQRRDGLAYAARADLGGLLGDERLHHVVLELLDLKRAGVEADHLHVAP